MNEKLSNSEQEPTPEQQLDRAERIIQELLLTVGDPDYDADSAVDDAYNFVWEREKKRAAEQ